MCLAALHRVAPALHARPELVQGSPVAWQKLQPFLNSQVSQRTMLEGLPSGPSLHPRALASGLIAAGGGGALWGWFRSALTHGATGGGAAHLLAPKTLAASRAAAAGAVAIHLCRAVSSSMGNWFASRPDADHKTVVLAASGSAIGTLLSVWFVLPRAPFSFGGYILGDFLNAA